MVGTEKQDWSSAVETEVLFKNLGGCKIPVDLSNESYFRDNLGMSGDVEYVSSQDYKAHNISRDTTASSRPRLVAQTPSILSRN